MEHREDREGKQSGAWGPEGSGDEDETTSELPGGQPPAGAPPGDQPPPPPPPTGAPPPPPPPAAEGPRRIYRSRQDRVLAGVCGGLGRHFGVDPLIFRIATLVLAFVGGTGVLLYLAAVLLMPNEPLEGVPAEAGAAATPTLPQSTGNRVLLVVAVVVGLLVIGPVILGTGLLLGGILFPLAFLALAGLFVWWLVSGEGPSGTGKETARRIGLGLGVLLLCFVIAFGGFWAAAAGGGVVAAGLIIAAGVVLVASAFAGGRIRWLILPALSLALPVAFVSAAGIDLDGGVGDREYQPRDAASVQDRYELGMGSLIVDLREAELPAGDREIELDVGVGEAILIVPEDVCVASRAEVGMGAVEVFSRDNGGIDLDWEDTPTAPSGRTRVLVDAEVGLGVFEVRHDDPHHFERKGPFFEGDRGPFYYEDEIDTRGNEACDTTTSALAERAPARG